MFDLIIIRLSNYRLAILKFDVIKLATGVSLVLLITMFGGYATVSAKGVECQTENQALTAMTDVEVEFLRADGTKLNVNARLADNNLTRAAGFQRVCASTIAEKPILFLFEQELRPSFHMNNVVAPIDIAFIDRAGSIDSIQAMQVYVLVSNNKPLYSPKKPVIAAFEAHPGFFSENQIDLTAAVHWRREEATQSE